MQNNYTETNILFNVFRDQQEFITYQADLISGTTEYQPEKYGLQVSLQFCYMCFEDIKECRLTCFCTESDVTLCINSLHFKVYSKRKTTFSFSFSFFLCLLTGLVAVFLLDRLLLKYHFFCFFLCGFIIDYIHKHICKFLDWARL